MRAKVLIKQISSLPDNNTSNPTSNANENGPNMPVSITPDILPREVPIPNRICPGNLGRGNSQTPLRNQYIAPNAHLHAPNLVTREAVQFQSSRVTNMQHPDNLSNAGYFYNSAGQQYLDPHIITLVCVRLTQLKLTTIHRNSTHWLMFFANGKAHTVNQSEGSTLRHVRIFLKLMK